MRSTALLLPLAGLLVGCPKNKPDAPPPVGWHQASEEWKGQCYYPPNWDQLGPGDRRMQRQDAMDAMMSQWKGERGDGISFSGDDIDRLETVLLGEPEKTEIVATQNLKHCIDFMSGTNPSGWSSWMGGVADKLTEGQCKWMKFVNTQFNYLNIDDDWQNPANVCAGDKVRIKGSTKDMYKISKEGEWITVAGNGERATSTDVPCNIEGCMHGMLILRFRDEAGVDTIVPVGEEAVFTAPNHGTITVQINDDTLYDNSYRTQSGITDHASIEYSPAE